MKKSIVLLIGCCIVVSLTSGCAGGEKAKASVTSEKVSEKQAYKDGTYEVQTEADPEGYFTKANVAIKDGKITSVEWNIYDSNRANRVFDETYEEVFKGQESYQEQCRADLKGAKTYSGKLIDTQNIEEVDAISGATWTNEKFKEVVKIALDKAKIE